MATLPLIINNCIPGWSIAGYELVPSDSTNVVYFEIMDKDSVRHIYRELNFDGFDYCLEHWQYEEVQKIER